MYMVSCSMFSCHLDLCVFLRFASKTLLHGAVVGWQQVTTTHCQFCHRWRFMTHRWPRSGKGSNGHGQATRWQWNLMEISETNMKIKKVIMRLVFGIRDQHAREKLLHKAKLTLAQTDNICRSHESTTTQIKVVGEAPGAVSAVEPASEQSKPKSTQSTVELCESWIALLSTAGPNISLTFECYSWWGSKFRNSISKPFQRYFLGVSALCMGGEKTLLLPPCA